jgi:hypothetical protein
VQVWGTSVGTIFGVLGLSWDCLGIVLGLSWDCLGIVLGLSWDCFGIDVLFLFWVFVFCSLLFFVVVSVLLLSFEKADLLHSTEYKVRVASSSPQGIFSPYSSTELGRTQKPTPPTEPRDTAMVSATGGAIFHQWRRPYDTGG